MTPAPHNRPNTAWKDAALTIAVAFGYFTRFPMPRDIPFSEARLARSRRYFPLVGAVVGALGAVVFAIAAHFWSIPIALLLSMAATLLATGALHEDGLADCCDAFGGGYRRADVLRILKDSRIGVFGAIGLIVVLALKWQTLAGLATIGPGTACVWMIVAHSASRAGAIAFTATLDYARSSGFDTAPTPEAEAGRGTEVDENTAAHVAAPTPAENMETGGAANAEQSAYAERPQDDSSGKAQPFRRKGSEADTRNGVAIALLIGLPGLFWHSMMLGMLLLVAGAALYWTLGRWWQRRIGGYTGDCLGLAQQLFEVGIYLMALGWISS